MGKLGTKKPGTGKWGNRQGSSVLHEAGNLVAESNSSEGLEKHLPIGSVRVDPSQPRIRLHQLGITPETIAQHLAGEINLASREHPERAEAFDELLGLANSIKFSGLVQAIVVTVTGAEYVIQVGERRFLAHLLIGKPDIRALVKKPPASELHLRIGQLVENLSRVDLDLDERLLALEHIDSLTKTEQDGLGMTSKEMEEMLGVGIRTAQRYVALLGAPEVLKQAVRDREIRSLKRAVELAAMSPDDRDRALQEMRGETDGEAVPPDPPKDIEKPRKAGRKATAVNMGRTKNPKIVRHIIYQILENTEADQAFEDIDWDDFTSTKTAWDRFIEIMDKRFTEEEQS